MTCEGTAYDPDDPFGADSFGESCDDLAPLAPPEVSDQLTSMCDDFEGAAVTVRFQDGDLEVETAGEASYLGAHAGSGDAGGDLVATLPETTAVAFGIGHDADLSTLLGEDTDDDIVVAGPSATYRATLLEDGGHEDTKAYQEAVANADVAGSVLFVNFDAGSWLTGIEDLPSEVQENLAPLAALGLSGWNDDGVNHAALRVTTE